MEPVEAGERPLLERGLQVRPPGGLPGPEEGPAELEGQAGQVPPVQAQKGPGGQHCPAHRLHPGFPLSRSASPHGQGEEQGAHGEASSPSPRGEGQDFLCHGFLGGGPLVREPHLRGGATRAQG